MLKALPPSNLLETSFRLNEEDDSEHIRATTARLLSKLESFGITGVLDRTVHGPVITTYYMRFADSVRYASVARLQNDLALALKAESVRISREPGTDTVAIEVARVNRKLVRLRSILESREYYSTFNDGVKLALGVKSDGTPLVMDLAVAPHLLIAGTTGGGKSISLHAGILSLLYRFTPDELQLGMIDMKQIELGLYRDIPHVNLRGIATTPQDGLSVLQSAVRAIQYRYTVLAKAGVTDLSAYHNKMLAEPKPTTEPWLPYVVIVIDEFADLMMTSNRYSEAAVVRIAQIGRAAGVHLIIATQRPTVNVVTGLIKANIQTRMSFKTASKIDSRVILDEHGAEQLLGRGDALIRLPNAAEPIRMHGAFVTVDEVSRVVQHIAQHQAIPMTSAA